MKTEYTKAPWIVHGGNISSSNKRWIADLPWLPNLQDEEGKVNARLMGKSPEMYELLKEVYETLDTFSHMIDGDITERVENLLNEIEE